MNFNIGGPSLSVLSNSSSSSSSDDDELILERISNNQKLASQLLANHHATSLRRGSIPGHTVIDRSREMGARNLFNDYFANSTTWHEETFRHRFRMSRDLFLRIAEAIKTHDHYFVQRRNAAGTPGLSTLQKITAAMRILALGIPADATDEYIRIGESTAIECLKRFCQGIIEVFGGEYLRSPNAADVARLLDIGKKRGFPGMLGSLDCMHWRWKNCPTAWAGQYAGRSGHPTIILEAVADYDLWIWHAYFGMPGSNNDINVIESSNLFSNLAQGIAPPANYIIQEKEYNMGYYLADGIYPKWATLVQSIHDPSGPKKKHFAMKQESCRKDVERAFGVLQSRFAILAGPVRYWNKRDLHAIMTACIIMHNMIVDDERDVNAEIQDAMDAPPPEVEMMNENIRFQRFLKRHKEIKDKQAHFALRDALIEHLWEEYVNSEN